MSDVDAQFFIDHPDRYAHIRMPHMVMVKDRQRGVRYVSENEGEFWSLGEHDKARRRIILWRPPKGHPSYDPKEQKILKIPFLAFSDEVIEDRDDILLPIVHSIMLTAVQRVGV